MKNRKEQKSKKQPQNGKKETGKSTAAKPAGEPIVIPAQARSHSKSNS